MDKESILAQATAFARDVLEQDSSGHDWWHIHRVTQLARTIAHEEGADPFVCELAALLHDIADEKLNESEAAGLEKVRAWLREHEVETDESAHVMEIISTMSFKGGNGAGMRTLEGRVVQDADRLDAIGAVGIARCFAYSGWKGQLIHDPEQKPREEMTAQEYRHGKSTAVNHFYEKLLLLKDRMNTEFAKKLAAERHRVMEEFLSRLHGEWDGKM
ncbi:HD domain-containing protein [Tumebacillus sp. DT12]|uniref:HD domain-containing protein n=1 Tax=Tumebacillus lacus TaxID=2995335 RepID=A0ABT3X2W4_9BACL|nr:HD domain-containing protein [Tumebacillus lacus]MCX7570308.1 HD domain-containing protein [Tumebacillus lacus]